MQTIFFDVKKDYYVLWIEISGVFERMSYFSHFARILSHSFFTKKKPLWLKYHEYPPKATGI